ncbi:MAG TPA: VCBS repeat-containing protein [Tepidisphaeraceae bacterium]
MSLAQTTAPSFTKQTLTSDFYSEGAAVGDLNKDGINDVVSGPFWYQGPDYKLKHRYGPGEKVDPLKYSEYFFSWVHDVNRDGWVDIVVTGFPGADTSWFENPKGPDQTWIRHKILDKTDNESPSLVDMDGDKIPDLLCMTGGAVGFMKMDSSGGQWVWKKVGNQNYVTFTHGLGAGDVNGDGKMDVLEHTGWWEQPADLNSNDTWVHHKADFGPGGAQMYAYDVDGDGLNDVITTIEAHRYGLAWFKQVREAGKITFKKHLIVGTPEEPTSNGLRISEMHAVALVDMNQDGLLDIITGKRFWAHGPKGDVEADAPAVLYWFELKRQEGKPPEFIAHKIDDDSGVGTQCMVGDVNGDKKPDVIIGNKKGTFVFTQN